MMKTLFNLSLNFFYLKDNEIIVLFLKKKNYTKALLAFLFSFSF